MDKSGKERRNKGMDLFVGIDVGSSFVHYVVLNSNREIEYAPEPIMHFANPIGAVREAWREITGKFEPSQVRNAAFTGSGAEPFTEVMEGITYVYDSVAIPKGAEIVRPQARYIFHIGAKDPYFFHLKQINGKRIIQEWRTGTKCGGGSGTLLEKQCRRLFEGQVPNPELEDAALAEDNIRKEALRCINREKLQARLEEMFDRAEIEAGRSTEPCEFLARCGVVIQSDLIHKQNEGAIREDNLAGLFRTVARNYKIDVLGSRTFSADESKHIAIVTGGVFANDLLRRELQSFVGVNK